MPYSQVVIKMARIILSIVGACLATGGLPEAYSQWHQWGGPNRDFKVASAKLAEKWPANLLEKKWQRPLGDGYSSIVASGDMLFTMFRQDDLEHLVALDAGSGKVVWKHSYAVEFREGTDVEEFGPGPLATPLLLGDRIVGIGVTGMMHCLDIQSGQVLWKHHVIDEFAGTNLYRGYSASPIGYENLVIVPIGGKKSGLVAFDQQDGSVAWQGHDFDIAHVSPLLIRFGNQDQLVIVAHHTVVAVHPDNGEVLWQVEHPIDGGYISSTPVFAEDGRLFFSAAYGNGSRCIQLRREGDSIRAQEVWHNQRLRIHHSNSIRIGKYLYGPSGDFSAMLYSCINVETGELAWQDRKIGRVAALFADEKFVMLQEDGVLILARMSPAGPTLLSQTKLFDSRAWTVPTIVGKRIYIRNREEIMAYELP